MTSSFSFTPSPGSKLLRFEETAEVGDVGLDVISGLV